MLPRSRMWLHGAAVKMLDPTAVLYKCVAGQMDFRALLIKTPIFLS